MNIKDEFEEMIKKILPWGVIILTMYVFTLLKLPLFIVNVFFVVSTSFFMYKLWMENGETKTEVIILCLGMAIRICACLFDIYGNDFFAVPFSGDDSINFYNTSVEYYYGDTSRTYTNYPYVLNAIYQVAGLNRFAAQYVNILCWAISALIMQKSCYLLKIENKFRVTALILLSFMPFNICISSVLMRDMLVYLSITITVYSLLKWMADGKYMNFIYGVIATVPAILIHNCVLGMLLVLGVMIALYSPQKNKFCIEKKFVFILLLGFITMGVFFVFPKVRVLFLSQMPFSDGGIITAINGRLNYFYTHTGGSTYLLNEYVTSYAGLFFGTFKRMLYFLLSPMPTMWRGISDIAAFCMSSILYIVCCACGIISAFGKKKDPQRILLFGVIFCVSAIFAWGVSNAGTAMRHREKLFFVTILLLIYCMQEIHRWFINKYYI